MRSVHIMDSRNPEPENTPNEEAVKQINETGRKWLDYHLDEAEAHLLKAERLARRLNEDRLQGGIRETRWALETSKE